MRRLNRIGIFPFAKFQAVLLGFIGLLAGFLYGFG
jgi:hypothetical protein